MLIQNAQQIFRPEVDARGARELLLKSTNYALQHHLVSTSTSLCFRLSKGSTDGALKG